MKGKMLGGLAGLVLGTTILSSCTTTDSNSEISPWDALNIFVMGKSTNSRDEAAANLSAIAGTMAQREHEMNVAREGRSQVNQNNNAYYGNSQPYQQAQPKPIVTFLCYNFVYDRNGDGKIDYPDEYKGIEKHSFSKNERIEFAMHLQTSGVKGKNLVFKIYNPQGEKIIESSQTIEYDFIVSRLGAEGGLMPLLVGRGGLGQYTARCIIEGDITYTMKFGIVE